MEVSPVRSQEMTVWSRGLTHLGQVCGMVVPEGLTSDPEERI